MKRRDFIIGSVNTSIGLIASESLAKSKKNIIILNGENTDNIPEWAFLQRELLDESTKACELFYEKYYDENGFFQCFERWGANDGPDDAIENVNDWPVLHALGASDNIKTLYEKAWFGHLKQYSQAKTHMVIEGRNGMYSRGFSVLNDWQHLSEALTVFNTMGLSNPKSKPLSDYAVFASDLYNGRDKIAKNYDRKLKIIKSMMTGSNGPLLRNATALDWAGDPFDTKPFFMEHGESDYIETLEHYADYNDIIGDSPLNLQATSLALSGYMFTRDNYIRDWIKDYTYAWANRMHENKGIIPSKIGLDGKINGEYGPWWAGVYGWGFSPIVPHTGKPENRNRVPRTIVGFFNAFLLTKDESLLNLWREQNNILNNNGKLIDNIFHTPSMYGADGWYGFQKGKSLTNKRDIWYFSMKDSDLADTDSHPWIDFLQGKNNDYPSNSLKADLKELRTRTTKIKEDKTTKNTRLADAVLRINTALTTNLVHQTMGGIRIARPSWSKTSPNQGGVQLFARLRHFDPENNRAGLPQDISVLVTALSSTQTKLEMYNIGNTGTRNIITQLGGFAEHRLESVLIGGKQIQTKNGILNIILKPKQKIEIIIFHNLYANLPTYEWPI